MPDALCYISSLIKISNKFEHISVGYVSKELPRSSLNLYALLKIFEFSKLENYKSDINETWPRYVPSGYLNITKMRVSMNGRVEGGAQTKNHQKMP